MRVSHTICSRLALNHDATDLFHPSSYDYRCEPSAPGSEKGLKSVSTLGELLKEIKQDYKDSSSKIT
jgi:hypothetical protein